MKFTGFSPSQVVPNYIQIFGRNGVFSILKCHLNYQSDLGDIKIFRHKQTKYLKGKSEVESITRNWESR